MSSVSQGASPHPHVSFAEFVALIAAMMALNALAIDVMLPALPDIGAAYSLAEANDVQMVLSSYLLGFGIAQLLFGPLSDRFGRKSIMLGGLALYVGASVVSVFAPTFETMLIARVVQGIGCAAPRVIAISIVRDCYGGRQMARVMSLAMMVFILVPVIAPSIGQAIIIFAPWRAIFGMLVFGGLAIMIWAGLRLPETLAPEDRKTLAVRSVAGAYREAFTNRSALGYMIATTLIFGGMFGFLNSAQQIFVGTYGLGAGFPVVFAMVALSVSAASFFNSRLVEQLGMRKLSHIALLALIAVFLFHSALGLTGLDTIYTFVPLMAAALFPFGIMMANFNALAMEPLGHIAGTASAAIGFVTTTGGAIIGYIIGQGYDGTALPMTLCFTLTGFLSLIAVLITERGRLFQPGTHDH